MAKKKRRDAPKPPTSGLTITRVALDTLKPDPNNPRTHDETNLGAIQGSLDAFGQVEPLVIQAGTGRIIAGHGRLEAMKRRGDTQADVVEVDVTDEQADAMGIALNRTSELSGWDGNRLIESLQSLPAELLKATGFGADGLKSLLTAHQPPTTEEDEPPAPLPEAVSRKGDLWLLGEHRLLQGDSTSHEDVTRLMNGERAVLFATDPPYLVDYNMRSGFGIKQKRTGKTGTKDWSKVYGGENWDDGDLERNKDLYNRFIACAVKNAITDHAAWYCWHASRRQIMVENAWEQNGAFVHQQVIWVKTRCILTRCTMLWQHEPCFIGWKKGQKDIPILQQIGALPRQHETAMHGWKKGDRPPVYQRIGDYVSTVWDIPSKEVENDEHPTSKPVRIFGIPMELHTQEGDLCYEPFSGSGSQIIAGEHLRRRVNAIEIEPRFVDVAVRRWQALTGLEATHKESGKTWRQTAKARKVSVPDGS